MLGLILVTRGTHSGKDVILGFPNSIFKQNLSYFDTVHYNSTISSSNSSKTFILGWPVSVIAELLCPKKERWDKILDFSAESIRFIGYPASVISKPKSKPVKLKSSHSMLSSESEMSNRIKENIAAFNIALVFEVDSPLLKHSDKIKEAVIAISKYQIDQTLKFEEKRSGYVSSEILKLKNIRETSQNKEEEILTMMNESSLAKDLITIFTDLLIKGESFIEINSWLKLNLLITPSGPIVSCSEFHSLLFFDNPKRLEPFVHEKSQKTLLMVLIKKCKFPTTSFKEIAEGEGVTLEAVFNAAQHFVRWNKGKTIPTINDDSLFVNSSSFTYSAELAEQFEKIFKHKSPELLKILSLFSTPKAIKCLEALSIGRAKAIPLITWLMRKGVVKSVHYYLYFTQNPANISNVDDGSEEFKTLLALLPYADGQRMADDVVNLVGLSIQDISSCAKRFVKYLKMVIH